MRIVTVGTGTAAPHADRVQSCVYVEAGSTRILVDCGSGSVYRLAKLGLPWQEVTHVALTHFHADHTSDLATLFFAWRWGMLPPRSMPISVIGPTGTQDLLSRHAAALGSGMLEAVPDTRVHEVLPRTILALDETVDVDDSKFHHT